MPRIWDSIHDVYIADGFSDDCDDLLHRCSTVDILTYSTFCNIWKDMQFFGVFQGRHSGAEIAEVSEEFLQVAKGYMVANTSNFEESVAGLFLVYGLLNLQPYSGFAALRISPDDVPALKRIEKIARLEHRHDVLYILGDVLFRGPCQFHIMGRERGMESCIRKYLKNAWTTISGKGVLPRGVFFRQNDEMDVIRELNNISKKYSEAKLAVTGNSTKDPSLFYVNENFSKEIDASLKNIINGILEEESSEVPDDNSLRPAAYERLDSVQSIKSKAMKTAVDNIRHLTSVATKEQKHSSKKQIKEKHETVTKEELEPKPSTSKRFASPVKAPLKRKKKKVSVSSSSDSDLNDDDERIEVEKEADINVGEFKKPLTIEIEIEKVPAFTKGVTNNKEYTIEVIDQFVPKKDTNVKGKGVADKKIEEKEYKTRSFKKAAMQSHFKRIGMLSVANFKEKETAECESDSRPDASIKKHQ